MIFLITVKLQSVICFKNKNNFEAGAKSSFATINNYLTFNFIGITQKQSKKVKIGFS